MVSKMLSVVSAHKTVRSVLCVVMFCVASQTTAPLEPGSSSGGAAKPDAPPATQVVGGFMNFTLSPACLRAVLVTAVACSQVGLAGLAGCGFLLHEVQASCP